MATFSKLRLSLVIALIPLSVVAQEARDPNPPVVNRLAPMNSPTAKKYERVTFHKAPRPLPAGAETHEWKTFMGPTQNCVSTETKLLKSFPQSGPDIVWELETGNGYASPSISGDYLVYPHRVANTVVIECLHRATGMKYWEHTYSTDYNDRYGYSNGPRASPVIDGNRVYVLGVDGQFLCLELQTGRVIWQRNINKDFNVKQDFFGTVGTPVLYGELLVLNVGGQAGPSVAAFHRMTGRLVWTAGKNNWGPSYASPMPATIHGQPRVMIFAGGDSDPPEGGLLSVDPRTGKVDFEYPFRSRKYESVNAMCPIVFDNQVFISATYRTGSALRGGSRECRKFRIGKDSLGMIRSFRRKLLSG